MSVTVLPFGDCALLAEYDDLDETLGAFRALEESVPAGVTDLIPAARTVLVRLDPRRIPLDRAQRWLEHTPPAPIERTPGDEVVLRVRYDGPDLAEAAETLGLSTATLVARHSGTTWTCAFMGFSPGFAYLAPDEALGGDAGPAAGVPRRATSRPSVPTGSVGLAGEFSGVYPRESPGGWQLIGTTDAVLWDADREPPALLTPGTRVRFEEAR